MEPMNHACAVDQEDLGPFLLGQLAPEVADAVAMQVRTCPTCSVEVERLRPVVAAMARSSPPPDPAAGPPVRTPLRSEPWPEPRVRRRRLVLAVAVVIVLLAGTGSVVAWRWPSDDGRRVVLAGADGASATAVLVERRWGTAIDLQVSGLDAGVTYGVWLERRTGGRASAGSFRPDGDGTFRVSLASAEQLDESRSVGVARLPVDGSGGPVDVLTAPLP